MKSSHKLAAALAVLVALLVAAYFILTALQSTGSAGGGQTTPAHEHMSEATQTTPEPSDQQTAASETPAVARNDQESKLNAAPPPPPQPQEPSIVRTLEVKPAAVETAAAKKPTDDDTVQPIEVIGTSTTTTEAPPASSTPPESEQGETSAASSTTTTTTTTSTTEPPTTTSTVAPQQGSSPEASTPAAVTQTTSDATTKLYLEATSPKPHEIAGGGGGEFQMSAEEAAAWNEFKAFHGKQYPSAEEEKRRAEVFAGNLRFINSFNRSPDVHFKLGVNKFADMRRDEINGLLIGPTVNWTSTLGLNAATLPPPMRILADPDEVQTHDLTQLRSTDWRNLTASGPLDQGTCLESSVFAVVASLESTLNTMLVPTATGNRIKLSESQIIDCLAMNAPPQPSGWPQVCHGLLSMVHVLDFLQRQSIRLVSQPEYEHFKRAQMQGMAPRNTCVPPPPPPQPGQRVPDARPKVGSYGQVHRDNIDEALLNRGPLVVALDASQPTFHFYKSGLYHELGCSTDTYNLHGLLVAYAPASQDGDTNQAHYTMRASFGPLWGEQGHMRLLKDSARNKCLPQHLATYPNLAFE